MQRSTRLLSLGLFGILCVASTAQAKVIWRGDFESGDRSQWNGVQMVAADRLQLVSDPVRQGKFALRVKVHKGDDPISASGNRNEVYSTQDMPEEGEERFYGWSTMWPSSYVSPDTWQLFTQFHHTGLNGSPPVEMFARGENIYLRVSGEDVWSAPLDREKWHDFALHVKWSSSASTGFVELYYDGKIALSKTYGATLFKGQSVYLKQGLYRNASVNEDQVIFHDGTTIGTTLDDVMPTTTNAVASGNGSTQTATNNPSSGSAQGTALGSSADVMNAQASGCSATAPTAAGGLLGLVLLARRRKAARSTAN